MSTERRGSLYAVHAREEIKEIRSIIIIIIIIVSLKSLLMGFPSSLPRRALLESDTTFAEACDAWWASHLQEQQEVQEEEEEKINPDEGEDENGEDTSNSSNADDDDDDDSSASTATGFVVEWTDDETTAEDESEGVVKRYCPCKLNTWRGFSEDGTREWECAVDDSEKTSTPFETSVMLIITMIVLCFALTFRLWKRKWQSRRREIEEREDLEASVRSESEIKFRTQDEMYEHWKSCVQPDGTKVICVEIEPRRKKNFDYDDYEDDLVIPLDANGNVVVTVADSKNNNSSAFSVLPPPVPPVVRARPTVLQQHLSGDEIGRGEEEEVEVEVGEDREFGYDVEEATRTTAFPELQNHGPEHTVGRRRRRRNSSVEFAIPAVSDLAYEEIEHEEWADDTENIEDDSL